MTSTKTVQLLELGKFIVATDPAKPYWLKCDYDGDGKNPLMQALSEKEFFALVNGMLKPIKQSCGFVHAQAVTVTDNEQPNLIH